MKKYLALVNTTTNLVDNVTVDEREISEISLPEGYIALDLATTPTIGGHLNEQGEWVEYAPALGTGGVGMLWDGEFLRKLPPA